MIRYYYPTNFNVSPHGFRPIASYIDTGCMSMCARPHAPITSQLVFSFESGQELDRKWLPAALVWGLIGCWIAKNISCMAQRLQGGGFSDLQVRFSHILRLVVVYVVSDQCLLRMSNMREHINNCAIRNVSNVTAQALQSSQ